MVTTELEGSTVVSKDQQDLIRGEFSPNDAHGIISHIISKKINFHEMRNFSNEVKFGKSEEFSVNRIDELKESLNALNEIIQKAKSEGKSVHLESHIAIEIV